jgi:hypothetical protein
MNNSSASNVIEGFEQLTRDEIIDISVRHVLRNGRPSVKDRGFSRPVCTYNGIGCAAAPFLTPQARNKYVGSWSALAFEGDVPIYEFDTIQTLQSCHDSSVGSDDFIAAFKSRVLANFGNVDALNEPVGGIDK